jgi:hypothetical protein
MAHSEHARLDAFRAFCAGRVGNGSGARLEVIPFLLSWK